MTTPRAVPRSTDTGPADARREDLASARRVLALEADGIRQLSESLGEDFARALDVLAGIEGRVVVTGMGKSGHIARKIAATLASTGTPAIFVHPAEASHGDLGMVTEKDALLALSNSGETSELADMVAYAKRFAIPLIGVTARRPSALADAATVALTVPQATEACPMGLAPTTSTTIMLALGDAIAVALLERKGFSADDFHVLHPGGRLGRRLLKVGDIMHTGANLPLIGAEKPMSDAIIEMSAKSFGCVGILDAAGKLVGIVTDGDLRRHIAVRDFLTRRTGDLMTAGAKTIAADSLASEAVQVMNDRKITTLFIVDGGRPVGILHIHDCLRAGVA